MCTIWVSFQVYVLSFHSGIPKNTEDNFSTTHNPCCQRRKSLSTMTHPIQRIWNVGVTCKLFRGLRYSRSSLSYRNLVYLSFISFIGSILPYYFQLGLVSPFIPRNWLSLPCAMNLLLRILRFWKKYVQ